MRRNRRHEARFSSDRLGDELTGLARGLAHAQVEGVAAAADAALRFLNVLREHDPFLESDTEGAAVRRAPVAVATAARSVSRDVLDIPARVAEAFYDEYDAPRRSRRYSRESSTERHSRSHDRSHSGAPESEVVDEAKAYLRRQPNRAATLKGLIDHVVLATDYDRSSIRKVIERNFVVRHGLVREDTDSRSGSLRGDAEWHMDQTLRDHGYTDIRRDVRLTVFDDLDQKARLVAYKDDEPVVLCYPVNSGVDDVEVREAARFQALALDEKSPARIIWVSDGTDDYFQDIHRDVALSRLPDASSDLHKSRTRDE